MPRRKASIEASPPQTFGQQLRALRQSRSLTQQALADQVVACRKAADGRGFDVTYLSKLENDRMAPPSAHAIRALARVLETSSEALLALAGKAPVYLGELLADSAGARRFYRRAQELGLREEDWEALLVMMETIHKETA